MPEFDGETVRIAPMTASDLSFAIEHAAGEGWNPGLSDAETFFAADPEGFWIARLGERPVGCISAVRYGSSFAFVGLFIVVDGFRGHGLGRELWATAAPHVSGRVIGLDGVVAMQPTYAKAGFVMAHRNVRYRGIVAPTVGSDQRVRPFEAADRSAVHQYDLACFGAPRTAFLDAWLDQPGAFVRVLVESGRLRGFAVARPCRLGYKVAPLFADEPDAAAALFDSLAAEVPQGSELTLDIPEPNDDARFMVESRGMTSVFETARMYAGGSHELPLRRVFGITSFELG